MVNQFTSAFAKMNNASVHYLAQKGKVDVILTHLKKNPLDIDKKDEVSYFYFNMQTQAYFYNIL